MSNFYLKIFISTRQGEGHQDVEAVEVFVVLFRRGYDSAANIYPLFSIYCSALRKDLDLDFVIA